jgi:uncharacterized membrane protein YjjP (DUF1212 family)
MDKKQILKIALLAGDILIRSGAEIYRVEDTIKRICIAYNIKCESYVTPTGIFISTTPCDNNDDTISLMKRVESREVDLHKIALVNTFSRSLQKNPLPYDEAINELNKIQSSPSFNMKVRLICAGITAFIYTLVFNGTALDGLFAFFICQVIYLYKDFTAKTGFFQIFDSFICGIIAASLSIISGKIVPSLNVDSVIIGSIVILVPGLIMTGGIKDAIHGDMVTSTARLLEAFLIIVSLGAGIAVMLSFKIHWM